MASSQFQFLTKIIRSTCNLEISHRLTQILTRAKTSNLRVNISSL